MRFNRVFLAAVAVTNLTAGASLSRVSGASEELRPPSEIAQYDCGTIALHSLLVLEGSQTPINQLRVRLSATTHGGLSMADLRDAAWTFGLDLTGVRLPPSGDALDRPAIVFLRGRDHGHFLVVRPVGHSGKLIQVIDSTGGPLVMDAVDLYASEQWTGLALVLSRPNWPLRLAVGAMVVFGSTFLVVLVVSRCCTIDVNPAAGDASVKSPCPDP